MQWGCQLPPPLLLLLLPFVLAAGLSGELSLIISTSSTTLPFFSSFTSTSPFPSLHLHFFLSTSPSFTSPICLHFYIFTSASPPLFAAVKLKSSSLFASPTFALRLATAPLLLDTNRRDPSVQQQQQWQQGWQRGGGWDYRTRMKSNTTSDSCFYVSVGGSGSQPVHTHKHRALVFLACVGQRGGTADPHYQQQPSKHCPQSEPYQPILAFGGQTSDPRNPNTMPS